MKGQTDDHVYLFDDVGFGRMARNLSSINDNNNNNNNNNNAK